MTQELKDKLLFLADKYETADFLKNDPSKFMHQISDTENQEIVAFLSANLAFGRRDQILAHIQLILDNSGNNIEKWILDEKFKAFFPNNEKSFYRTYSNHAMLLFFDTIKQILIKTQKDESKIGKLGIFFKEIYLTKKSQNQNYDKKYDGLLHKLISAQFPKECSLLPHSEESAAKKVNMFLRWMVRQNSPVDLGIWKWYDKKNLIMPLDTHVMQEATKLGLLQANKNGKPKAANLKTALELTDKLAEVFPGDPVKGDFALFASGVNAVTQ